MAQKKASLACAECGSRNYSINVSSTPKPTRLEVKRHRETNWKYFQSLERHDLARP